eukprot:601612-Prymnesium_polylepis.1
MMTFRAKARRHRRGRKHSQIRVRAQRHLGVRTLLYGGGVEHGEAVGKHGAREGARVAKICAARARASVSCAREAQRDHTARPPSAETRRRTPCRGFGNGSSSRVHDFGPQPRWRTNDLVPLSCGYAHRSVERGEMTSAV